MRFCVYTIYRENIGTPEALHVIATAQTLGFAGNHRRDHASAEPIPRQQARFCGSRSETRFFCLIVRTFPSCSPIPASGLAIRSSNTARDLGVYVAGIGEKLNLQRDYRPERPSAHRLPGCRGTARADGVSAQGGLGV